MRVSKQKCSELIGLFLMMLFSSDIAQPIPTRYSILTNGKNLWDYEVRGQKLTPAKGGGLPFDRKARSIYQNILKQKYSKERQIEWIFSNLSQNKTIHSSANPKNLFYGASISKLFTVSAFIAKKSSKCKEIKLWQGAIEMLTVSDNSAWSDLQIFLGAGNNSLGQRNTQIFIEQLGLNYSTGFRGQLGQTYGNIICALDVDLFLRKTFQNAYRGANDVWKIMHAVRSGNQKARYFIPADVEVGGKDGFYEGIVYDPSLKTQAPSLVNHDILLFKYKGMQYAVTILSKGFLHLEIAALSGGLYSDFTTSKIF